jgi:hypothetical protein
VCEDLVVEFQVVIQRVKIHEFIKDLMPSMTSNELGKAMNLNK